jgi:hypothetical protein
VSPHPVFLTAAEGLSVDPRPCAPFEIPRSTMTNSDPRTDRCPICHAFKFEGPPPLLTAVCLHDEIEASPVAESIIPVPCLAFLTVVSLGN